MTGAYKFYTCGVCGMKFCSKCSERVSNPIPIELLFCSEFNTAKDNHAIRAKTKSLNAIKNKFKSLLSRSSSSLSSPSPSSESLPTNDSKSNNDPNTDAKSDDNQDNNTSNNNEKSFIEELQNSYICKSGPCLRQCKDHWMIQFRRR